MRVIERKMIAAIRSESDYWKNDNTSVRTIHSGIHHTPSYDKKIEVRLHGNLIAEIFPLNRSIRVSSCGWRNNTTKSRLNAILHEYAKCGIHQNDYTWYFGDKEFEDNMIVSFN